MIDPLDYPYSIYKSSDGDALLDAHNDIIAVFDPHTEPEIERMVAAAPEMADKLKEIVNALDTINDFNSILFGGMGGPLRIHPKILDEAKALLRRIEGDDPE